MKNFLKANLFSRERIKRLIPFIKTKTAITLIVFLSSVILLDLLFPLPKLKPYSKVVYAKDNSLLSAYLSQDDKWRMRTRLDEVSPELKKAILEKEDSWFYWHLGVNSVSVIRALSQNIFSGKRISGASTITMQVARLLEPGSRTYLNKFFEMLRAFQLELHYSKDDILEMYLSHLPYGGNIEGVKSASYIYFNRPPNKLSLSQAITLAVIPNDPNALRLDKGNTEAVKQRNKWIKYFAVQNIFSPKDLRDALDEPLQTNRYQIKNEAPHFCQFVAQKFPQDEIFSSLNQQIQKTAEKILAGYVNRVKARQVSNGSVIIIDNKTNSVVGYCGSADFNDASSAGQVNGINALRSPGSTLKPFLYTLAFDLGELTPKMKLLDIQTDFGGYEPENFDLTFNGPVTAEYALVNSLNIPAIRLLQKVGLDKLISILEKSGFTDVSQEKKSLGLSMIIGGCGVRLEQLAKSFTVFSHDGNLYPLNYLRTSQIDKSSGTKIFSPEAVYMTGSILTSHERPDYPTEFLFSTEHPMIAWKTGTSFGKRDAWAVGFNPDYTIGVWMGNFDGKGAPELSGAEMAVPLLFELFNAIDYKPKKLWFNEPKHLYKREVCSETGLLPSESCTQTVADYYIENVSPNTKCNLYKTLYVSEDESVQYCPECLPQEGYKKIAYPFYDSELLLWFARNKVAVKRPPPHNPLCQTIRSGDGPKILSPSDNYEYFIEEKSNRQVLLNAASDPTVKVIYWYINDRFYKKSKPGEKIFFKPEKGISKIVCLDDQGRKTFVQAKIIYY
jgi:penicillin-binding protein 1C